MEIKEKIIQRMNDLSKEIEDLVSERSSLHDRINEINVRIAHIVGAIQELDSLCREDKNE